MGNSGGRVKKEKSIFSHFDRISVQRQIKGERKMLLSIRHMSHKKEMIEWMEMAKLNSILFNLMTGDYREIKQIRNLLKWDR